MPAQRQADTSFKTNFSMELENAINRCKNHMLKQKIVEISEILKYSDPVSSAETVLYENRIMELFSEVKNSLYDETQTTAISLCDETCQLMKQRNTVCAASKKL